MTPTQGLRMRKRQTRISKATEFMKDYMTTYSDQAYYEDYSQQTFIDDVLYGLGVALDPKKHIGAAGYDLFKKKLLRHLRATFR